MAISIENCFLFKRLAQDGLLQRCTLREGAGEVGLKLVHLGLERVKGGYNGLLSGKGRKGKNILSQLT